METTQLAAFMQNEILVLIVPCGMETCNHRPGHNGLFVLIVPCGMETSWSTTASNDFSVLIVPCGMETKEQEALAALEAAY